MFYDLCHIVAVVNTKVDDAVEDTIFSGERQFAYIDAHLVGYHRSNLIY